MRTIEEIKADEFNAGVALLNLAAIKKVVDDISFDRLETICAAERDGRLVVLDCSPGEIWTDMVNETDVKIVKIQTDKNGTYVYYRYKGYKKMSCCNPIYFKMHFKRAALKGESHDER